MKTPSSIVPENERGKSLDLYAHTLAPSEPDAIVLFRMAVSRLLHPMTWGKVAGAHAFDVKIWGQEAGDLRAEIREGDYLKIDIPGPGSSAGDGYDWVKADRLEEGVDPDASESMGMRLRTCRNPEEQSNDTAHFFKEGAASIFILARSGNEVSAKYFGRNEETNDSGSLFDRLRNYVVSLGAKAGGSEKMWTDFINGLITT
ncbi:hypothetical protein [Flavihumibacter petaseus]|uniref:Uncharacterized protein n=1 Tax=Flavihumibacter petaseus NBRC 106054 TaxID=1220578 RepID=A0A0E9MWP1_9BACT|nr:hypothetical protein [Flavihumibacter petaseus]GAO41908.1 hypothetical protein FPE01S_01_09230 [Flavihumibacter petaseus NBRC 106054]